jgi:hypothetical protein
MTRSKLRELCLAAVVTLAPAAALAGAPVAIPPAPIDPQYLSPPTSKRVTDKSSINGVWETWLGRNDPAHPPSPNIPPAPLKPEYQAKVDAATRANREASSKGKPPTTAWSQCLPEGFPSMMRSGSFAVEILVTPGQVTMINELLNQVHRIYLDEPQGKIGEVEPVFFGHSVGHWEGDTLVVDTIGVKEDALFREMPHSDQQRITERIRLLSPDWLEDQTTIEDPVVLTAPWKFTWIMKRNNAAKLQEYVCENNREFDDSGAQRLKVSR